MSREETPLPPGVAGDPGKVPPLDVLDAMTEGELYQVIRFQQVQNYVTVSAQFWIDELSRRRTAAVLDRIATAGAQEAEAAARIAQLTADAAAENARTATLNQEMRDMNAIMVKLTRASVVVAAAALLVALAGLIVAIANA